MTRKKSLDLALYCYSLFATRYSVECSFIRDKRSPWLAAHRPVHSFSMTAMEDPVAKLGLPSPLILGSGSFTRKLILKEMGIDFQVIKRPIDEKSLGDRTSSPEDLVLTLAKAKMDHLVNEIVAGRCDDELPKRNGTDSVSEWIVLTGDQVVVCDGSILEKPESVQEAKDFVGHYALMPPSTVGSCVIKHIPSGIQVEGVDTATIYFKQTLNGDELVDRLLAKDAPILDCAGGLMVEHPSVREYLDKIDGTEDSVLGLSKRLVLKLLDELSAKLRS
ncbi:septum formation protein [Fistulifera solaris]|uniref:Septum formation protein n=1 Tax=Fistulifera solaris TaxID=1519565 RepID=A0A1Z5J5Q2_FISSO|nr:septum formation protein [Fistulifera solaris]|eukprot:GAX09327.1 septum formation protein [Fistulifera solaris]